MLYLQYITFISTVQENSNTVKIPHGIRPLADSFDICFHQAYRLTGFRNKEACKQTMEVTYI